MLAIQQRKTHFTDILEKRKDGQNIYHLVGHSRSHIQLPGIVSSNGQQLPHQQYHVILPNATLVKSVPVTNLF
jgi:hypothetical protein